MDHTMKKRWFLPFMSHSGLLLCWDSIFQYHKVFTNTAFNWFAFQTDLGFSMIRRREFPTLCPVLFLFLKKYLDLYLPQKIYFILCLLVLNISAESKDQNGNANDSVPVKENHPKAQLLNKDHWGKGNGSLAFISELLVQLNVLNTKMDFRIFRKLTLESNKSIVKSLVC